MFPGRLETPKTNGNLSVNSEYTWKQRTRHRIVSGRDTYLKSEFLLCTRLRIRIPKAATAATQHFNELDCATLTSVKMNNTLD